MPVFAFYLPLYSFWHNDDFTWGNTRIVKEAKDEEEANEYQVSLTSWVKEEKVLEEIKDTSHEEPERVHPKLT
jgi:chitin synthase